MQPTNYYESMGPYGDIEYGTSDPRLILDWYSRYPDRSIYVSVWNEESEEEFKLLNDRTEITSLIDAAIAHGRERARRMVTQ